MKIRNDAPEKRHHGEWEINVGEVVDVTSDQSADWLIRHGCVAVDATPAPEMSDVDTTGLVKPARRKRRSARR